MEGIWFLVLFCSREFWEKVQNLKDFFWFLKEVVLILSSLFNILGLSLSRFNALIGNLLTFTSFIYVKCVKQLPNKRLPQSIWSIICYICLLYHLQFNAPSRHLSSVCLYIKFLWVIKYICVAIIVDRFLYPMNHLFEMQHKYEMFSVIFHVFLLTCIRCFFFLCKISNITPLLFHFYFAYLLCALRAAKKN